MNIKTIVLRTKPKNSITSLTLTLLLDWDKYEWMNSLNSPLRGLAQIAEVLFFSNFRCALCPVFTVKRLPRLLSWCDVSPLNPTASNHSPRAQCRVRTHAPIPLLAISRSFASTRPCWTMKFWSMDRGSSTKTLCARSGCRGRATGCPSDPSLRDGVRGDRSDLILGWCVIFLGFINLLDPFLPFVFHCTLESSPIFYADIA